MENPLPEIHSDYETVKAVLYISGYTVEEAKSLFSNVGPKKGRMILAEASRDKSGVPIHRQKWLPADEKFPDRTPGESLWCDCEADLPEYEQYHADGEGTGPYCVHKHHYHCGGCGKIIQIG